jgi:demethylmenaquinone methyltransferase / 2-methoxy-6-polyprenyl-1,4-benzoquinol methylase
VSTIFRREGAEIKDGQSLFQLLVIVFDELSHQAGALRKHFGRNLLLGARPIVSLPRPIGLPYNGIMPSNVDKTCSSGGVQPESSPAVDKAPSRVQEMFAQIAPRYDFLNRLLSLGIDRRWRRRTVKLVPPDGDGPILDVCTGTADLALVYWRAGRGKTPIVGTDFCQPMLEIARRKCGRAGADNQLTLIEADTLHLPFAADTFQIVCVAFGLRNVSDTDAGLREMTRVCRPGGRVAVLEFSTPTAAPLGAVYGWYFRRVLPRIGQALARNSQGAYNYLPESVGGFPQAAVLAERMRAAGLGELWRRPMTFGIATLYVGRKLRGGS